MSGPLLMKSKVKGAVQVIITDVIVVDMLGDPTGANKPGICKKQQRISTLIQCRGRN